MAKAVLPIILTLFTILTAVHPGSTGEPCKTVKVNNMYCCNVECLKGKQPVCSQDEAPTSECEDCPGDMFSAIPTTPYRRCQRKKLCHAGRYMLYIDRGSSTRDAVCGCEEGYEYKSHVEKCERAVKKEPDESQPDANPPPLGVGEIIGIIVGSVMLLLILIIVGVICWRSRQNQQATMKNKDEFPEMEPLDSTDSSGENTKPRDRKAIEKSLTKVIVEVKAYLIEHLDEIDFAKIAKYEKEKVIDKRTSLEIKSMNDPQAKVDMLMKHISNEPVKRFHGFCKLLGEFGQGNVIQEVNDAIDELSCSAKIKTHLKEHYGIHTEKNQDGE